MKFVKFLYSRMFLTIFLILIQLVWFIIFWVRLVDYSIFISILFSILSISMILFIITYDNNPSFKIGWIIIIMALPLLGGLLYIFFGSNRPLRKIRNKINSEHNELLRDINSNFEIEDKISKIDERIAGTISYLQDKCNFPVWENTQITYYTIGEEMYKSLLEELEKAEKFIFMEYFIIDKGIMWDGIFKILKRKAALGLDVRLMYDDVGCLNLLPRKFYKDIEGYGIKCMAFNPFVPILSIAVNNRDHRKITVIDGKVAFNGGINLADEYINAKNVHGHWKDTGIRIVGDGVWNCTAMFLEMWNAFRKTDESFDKFKALTKKNTFNDGFIVPFGDSPFDDESISQNIYIDILNQAKKYVYIFTPYLIIDYEMENALKFAAKRRVDVRIVTPFIGDNPIVHRLTRSFYGVLLTGGVKIYEYTPGFIHAKSYVSDDEIAVVGSINMDFRSLFLHFECGTFMYKSKAVKDIRDDCINTFEKCKKISLESTRENIFWKFIDAIFRVFAPLM